MAEVRLLTDRFDAAEELSHFASTHGEAGGIASFLGQVRPEEGVEALELQHYGPLTLPGMQSLAKSAETRWPLSGLLVIHRSGRMVPGDPIVLVAAASRHRRDAFAAAEYVMDHLKSDSWFWKRERREGEWRWVQPRGQDYEDIRRWA